MALTVNTNIINDTDQYLLDAKNVKGGYVVVNTLDDLNTDDGLLVTVVEGTLCYCTSDSKFYQYNGTSWDEQITKANVGLSNVVNTGDSDTPVSGGTTKFTTGGAYTELNKKVDKVTGKGLSTNDYTTAEKNKLAGIAANANNYAHPDSGATAGSYTKVTVDAQGHVTGGSNPTTLAGYGITDAASASHGTHVTYAATAPSANGTASAGSANNVARGDHVHPAQTTISGNAGSATKLKTARTISLTGDVTGSVSFDGTDNVSITATVADDSHNHVISNIDGLQDALDGKAPAEHSHSYIPTSQKGASNGVAELDATGKVPTAQLPSYVDDVIEGYYHLSSNEFYKESSFSAVLPRESGKIYINLTDNKTYRWSGSTYTEISASLALGTTSSTAFRGDYGNTAYQHSQTAHAPSDAQKNVQSDWNATSGDAFIKNKPTIPTVNNGTLTIQKNGTNVATFSANQSGNATANIVVPTKVSELTNDSGFKTVDTNTTYDLAATKSSINGNVKLNLTAGGSGSGTDSVTIQGSGATTVTTDANGVVTISSTDSNTTYSSKSAASGGTDVSLVTTGEKYTWNNKSNLTIGTTSTTAAAGNHTHSSYVNQNAFSNIAVTGQTTVAADSATDTLTLVAGSNVTITTDATNDKVTIASKDTTYGVASSTADGLMSKADKAILDALVAALGVTYDATTNTVTFS